MQYLRADTITEVTIGPAVAVGDGFTPVTSLVGSTADEFELIKHGATTTTTIAGTLAAITGADGYYALDLSATDTNTEGRLTLLINDDSLILPIRHEFMVVNTNVFDSLFAASGTDVLDVSATQWAGTAIPAPTTTGVPDVNVERWLDTLVTLGAGAPDVNVQSMDAGTVTATSIATDAIDADAIAADAVTELRSLVSGTSDAGGTVTTMVDAALTEIDDTWNGNWILFTSGTDANRVRLITDFDAATDTITFAPAVSASIGAGVTYEILPAAGVDVQSWIATESAHAAPNSLVAGAVVGNVGAIQSNVVNATALAADAVQEIVDGVWDEDIVAAHATADTAGLTLSELTKRAITFSTAVVDGSALGQMADDGTAVFDRTTDSLQAISDGGGGPTAAQIADAVWDEDATAHQTTGTFGQAVGDPVANTKSLYDAVITDAVGTSVTADVATVQADTDDIQTRLPAALVGGRMDSDVGAMQAGTVTAAVIATDAVDDAALTEADDIWTGNWLLITSGTNANQCRLITDFAATADELAFTPPVNASIGAGVTYEIIPNAGVDIQSWVGLNTAMQTPNALVGGAVDSDVSAMQAGSIASGTIAAGELTNIENEIWDALKSAHVVANSFGDFLDIEVSSRSSGGGTTGTTTSVGTTTTFVDTGRTEIDDTWNGQWVQFTSGTEANRVRLITDFDAATDTATFAPAVSAAVASGVTYEIIPAAGVDVQSWIATESAHQAPNPLVAGAVDADVSAIQTDTITAASIAANAIGNSELASGAISNTTLAADSITATALHVTAVNEIADGIWDEDATGHQTTGTFGQAIGDPVANTETIYDAVVTDATGINVATDVAAVLVDTGTTLDNHLTDIKGTGFVKDTDSLVDIRPETDKIALADAGAGVAGSVIEEVENRATPTQVNTEVSDVLKTDTIAELAQGIPSATPTFEDAIMLMYMAMRNKLDITSSFKEVHNDAGTVITKKALTDDGTTYSEAEMVSGP
jgi:hypothetical protein